MGRYIIYPVLLLVAYLAIIYGSFYKEVFQVLTLELKIEDSADGINIKSG